MPEARIRGQRSLLTAAKFRYSPQPAPLPGAAARRRSGAGHPPTARTGTGRRARRPQTPSAVSRPPAPREPRAEWDGPRRGRLPRPDPRIIGAGPMATAPGGFPPDPGSAGSRLSRLRPARTGCFSRRRCSTSRHPPPTARPSPQLSGAARVHAPRGRTAVQVGRLVSWTPSSGSRWTPPA